MAKKRLQNLVRLLLNQDDFTTIQSLAEQLGVSYKTAANDLGTIEKWLAPYQLELVKKTGIGVQIVGSDEAKLQALELAEQVLVKNSSLSPQARMTYIGMKLLLNESCRVYLLAKELFVSRAAVHNDLNELADFFVSFKIELKRDSRSGIRAEGSEKNFRNCLVELMKRDAGYAVFCRLAQGEDLPCYGNFPFAALPLADWEIKHFLSVVQSAESRYLLASPFDNLVQVLLYCFVSFIRISGGHPIQLSEAFVEELESQPYYCDMKIICRVVEEVYPVTYSEMEMRYLQVFFLSLQNTDEAVAADQKEAAHLADELISNWEKLLPYPFSKDLELREALFQHFGSAITRYKHQIPFEHDLTEEIRLKLPHTFAIVSESKPVIEGKYQCQLDEAELGLLTLYLAAALEKMKQPLQTLLVCHKGAGAAQLLLRKLESNFSNILSVQETLLLPDMVRKDLLGIDLVLTTAQLPVDLAVPVLKIEPILSRQELLLLRKSLLPYYEEKNDHLKKQEKR